MTVGSALTGPVLVLNSGSSSLKYQLLIPATAHVLASGSVERIGEPMGLVSHRTPEGRYDSEQPVPDHGDALTVLRQQFSSHGPDLATANIAAVGHRVVHGGATFLDPVLIDDLVTAQIEDLSPLAPLHNPAAVAGMHAARGRFPDVAHVAVFDTAFFATLPPAAYTYAIPRALAEKHRIRRYGFHGTSHAYVSREAAAFLHRDYADLNQVVLHLGNGCSASAIRGGIAVETSMGLTPLQGLVMGTRSGDVDPGLHRFLAGLGMSIEEIDDLLNKESGLKGLAGVNDFRELERLRRSGDEAAQLAFDVYVHRIKHYLGAYLVLLGRLDVLVFTAGVGEHNPALRAAVLEGLSRLGLEIAPALNEGASTTTRVISTPSSSTAVLVVPTNEELAIARQTMELIS
jgi:acetate kinase